MGEPGLNTLALMRTKAFEPRGEDTGRGRLRLRAMWTASRGDQDSLFPIAEAFIALTIFGGTRQARVHPELDRRASETRVMSKLLPF